MRTHGLVLLAALLSVGSFDLRSQTEIKAYADAHNMFLLRDALKRDCQMAGIQEMDTLLVHAHSVI
jgi:hypothetical protein